MTVAESIAVSVFLALLVGALWAAKRMSGAFGISPEGTRKMVHVSLGASALLIPFVFDRTVPVVVLCSFALLLLLAVRRNGGKGLGSALHGVKRNSLGEIYFAMSIAALFLLVEVSPKVAAASDAVSAYPAIFYLLPIAIMTLADTAAALAGTEYGKRLFDVERGRKSLEGVAAFFVTAWIVAVILILLLTEIPRDVTIVLAGMIALVGATLEAESWGGLDNLFVPVGLHLIFVNLSAADLSTVTLAVAGYGALVCVSYIVARATGIAWQPLRAAILLLTVVAIGFGMDDALPVFLALGMSILANHLSGPRDKHADLHTIFAMFGIGMFWLLLGNSFGLDFIAYFNVAMVTYAATMAGLSFRNAMMLPLAFAACAAVLAAKAFVFGIPAGDADRYLVVGLVGITSAMALAMRYRRIFVVNRAVKVTAIAMFVSCLAMVVS